MKEIIKDIFEIIFTILVIISFLFLCFIACKLGWIAIKDFLAQPIMVKHYEYVDLDGNQGIAKQCYSALSTPHCYITDNHVINVKEYKEIWTEKGK